MQSTVSVIIPTYNYARYITQAIDSIINQTYPLELIEIIVIDDGSNDNTFEVLKTYISNGIVQYFYQVNQGKAQATNIGIQRSSGEYIFNLDADDFFFKQKIEQSIRIFESDIQIIHVASAAKIVDDKTGIISDYEKLPAEILERELEGQWLLQYFSRRNILYGGGSTYAARASILKRLEIPASVDMYIDEFLIIAILPFGKSYFIREPLSIWRSHGYNYSEKAKVKEERESKTRRLLNSSDAILQYLKKSQFDNKIVKIYELKYLTSLIASKEEFNDKSIFDVLNYAYNVFIKIRPEYKLIKRYHVMNRLLPTQLLFFLKKKLKSNNYI